MAKSRRRKKSNFKKALLIYVIILLFALAASLIYIYKTLITYEDAQTNNYLAHSIRKLSDQELIKFLKDNNQDEKLLNDYKILINSKDVEFKSEKDNEYQVYLNNRMLFTIKTKPIKEVTKLGLFTYEEKEVIDIKPELERGLIYYDVIVPSNFLIYVDGKLQDVKPTKTENYKGLDVLYYNDSMPKLATYEINNLEKEKEITAKDFLNNDVKLKKEKNTYTTDMRYIKADSIEEAKKYLPDIIDVAEVAHNWSLFLTRDLKAPMYGLNIINNYLIPDTDIAKMAYNWAHSVDITFTSRHTLTNPIFSNEKINNFQIYGTDAFVCEIYTEKGMIVNNNLQPDKMHDNLYFIKDNGVWKLINIKSVEE